MEGRAAAGLCFSKTRASVVAGLHSDDRVVRRRSLDIIATTYYRPVYAHLRLRWRKPRDVAEELTHDFFAWAIERGTFASFDTSRARFRGFLKACLDRFVVDVFRAENASKRGGRARLLHLDVDAIERDLGSCSAGADAAIDVFDAEYARTLCARTVDALAKY